MSSDPGEELKPINPAFRITKFLGHLLAIGPEAGHDFLLLLLSMWGLVLCLDTNYWVRFALLGGFAIYINNCIRSKNPAGITFAYVCFLIGLWILIIVVEHIHSGSTLAFFVIAALTGSHLSGTVRRLKSMQ